MGTFIKLPGVTFTGGNMPKAVDLVGDILALPNLISWHTARTADMTWRFGNVGRVGRWANRVAGAPDFKARDGVNAPAFSEEDSGGLPGVFFQTDRLDVLDYDGTYPYGVGAASSRILIGKFPTSGGSTFWYYIGADGATSDNRNVLGGNFNNIRAINDGGQTLATLTSAPASRNIIGWSHSDATNSLKAYADGVIEEVSNTDVVALPDISLGHPSSAPNSPTMTLRDVFIFDADVISIGSAALDLINEYAERYGI